MWSGKDATVKPIIKKLKDVFQVSHGTDDAFKYIDMQITQESDMGIRVDYSSNVNSIKPITLEQNRMANKLADLSNDEITFLRGALGQLNWLANMTRPDISFAVSKLSDNIKKSTIADI